MFDFKSQYAVKCDLNNVNILIEYCTIDNDIEDCYIYNLYHYDPVWDICGFNPYRRYLD